MSLFKKNEINPEEFLQNQQREFDQKNQALQDMFEEYGRTGFENHMEGKKSRMFNQNENDWFDSLVDEERKNSR